MGIPWRRSQGRWPLIRRFAKLAPRGAKFSPGGRPLATWAQAGRKGDRARETSFIVQSRLISEILSARFPMPLKYTDDTARFAVGHAASPLVSVMPLDTIKLCLPRGSRGDVTKSCGSSTRLYSTLDWKLIERAHPRARPTGRRLRAQP